MRGRAAVLVGLGGLLVGVVGGGGAGYHFGYGAGASEERAERRAELMRRVDEILAEPLPGELDEGSDPEPPAVVAVDAGPRPDAGPPPVAVLRSRVHRNSAGTSELSIVVRNDTRQTVDGFRFEAECYDNFNTRIVPPSWRHSSELVRGQSDNRVDARETRTVGVWSMFDHDGCTKAIVTVTQVHFTDNTTWLGESRQIEDPREPTTE